MSVYSLTRTRTFQYVGILLTLTILAAGYWYFSARASTKVNKTANGDLASGLIGYWKLDENTGTSAADATGNGNTGTLTNGPTWTTGRIGSSVNFDGTDDSINIPDSPLWDFNPGTQARTFSVWVNFDTLPAAVVPVAGADGVGAYTFYVYGTGMYLYDGSSGVSAGDAHLVTGSWTLLTWVIQGGTLTCYRDGSVVGSASLANANQLPSGFFIGWDGYSAGFADGKIDEARFYNRALSADEVGQLYRLTTPTDVDAGLVGHWTFDGPDVLGTTAIDRGRGGNNGTLTNGPTVMPGKIGQGMKFDGVDDDVTVTDPGTGSVFDFANGTSITLSAWVKPDTFDSTWGSIVGKEVTGTSLSPNYSILHSNCSGSTCSIVFYYDTGSCNETAQQVFTTSSAVLTAGIWQHIIVTYTFGTGSSMKIFLNGVEQAGSWTTGSGNIAPCQGNQRLIMGRNYDGDTFKGLIDDVRVYNRALSATEVTSLYDMGKVKVGTRPGDDVLEEGLAGYWKLDENTGTSATDASGNGSTGTLTNGPTWSTGKIGSAVTFDGTDDYIEMGNVTTLNSLSRVTASAWVKTTTGSGEKHIFDKSACNGVLNTGVFELLSNYVGTGRPTFALYKNGGTPDVYATDSTVRIDDNTWHLVTGVYDGTNLIIYVDGVNTGQTAAAGITTPSTTNTLQIGGNCNGNGTFEWNGSIDEVRAYTRALSPDEVVLLYRETHPDDPDTSMVGHWTFDGMDVSGTTAIDRGRGGNKGTLTNGPTVTPGRLGQALNFDGTDDKVNCGDTTTLRNLEDQGGGGMTVMAWIRPRSAGGSGGKGHIVGKENNDSGPGDGQWALSLSSTSNRLLFGHSRATQSIAAYANNAWATNTWQHVAVTFNGGTVASTAIHIYANGTELSHAYDQDGSGAYSTDATANLLIGGGYSAGNGWNFDGLIDDVRVYNRVLSATEIAALYKSSGGKATLASSGNDTLRSGLVGQWSMDGQDVNWADTTTEVKDRSGNANHGDATNMSAASVAPGRIGQGLNFDGFNDSVNMGNPASLQLTGSVTLSTWFKAGSFPGGDDNGLVAKGDGIFAYHLNLTRDYGPEQVYMLISKTGASPGANAGQRYTTTTFAADQWYHVVGVFNASAQTIDLYVNGVLDNGTLVGTIPNSVNNTGDSLRIGSSWGTGYYAGIIDDVRVYNRALSADEVTQLYNMGR